MGERERRLRLHRLHPQQQTPGRLRRRVRKARGDGTPGNAPALQRRQRALAPRRSGDAADRSPAAGEVMLVRVGYALPAVVCSGGSTAGEACPASVSCCLSTHSTAPPASASPPPSTASVAPYSPASPPRSPPPI